MNHQKPLPKSSHDSCSILSPFWPTFPISHTWLIKCIDTILTFKLFGVLCTSKNYDTWTSLPSDIGKSILESLEREFWAFPPEDPFPTTHLLVICKTSVLRTWLFTLPCCLEMPPLNVPYADTIPPTCETHLILCCLKLSNQILERVGIQNAVLVSEKIA